MQLRKTVAAAMLAVLPFTAVACADEDGDGDVLDEEVTEASDAVDSAVDEVTETTVAVTETTAN